jgi:ParB-like chromosome segregation protein Spo0J
MEFHEVCSLFPAMTDDEFRELSFDIAKHGVLEPIWVHGGQIIDGRHRYRAAMVARNPSRRRESGY